MKFLYLVIALVTALPGSEIKSIANDIAKVLPGASTSLLHASTHTSRILKSPSIQPPLKSIVKVPRRGSGASAPPFFKKLKTFPNAIKKKYDLNSAIGKYSPWIKSDIEKTVFDARRAAGLDVTSLKSLKDVRDSVNTYRNRYLQNRDEEANKVPQDYGLQAADYIRAQAHSKNFGRQITAIDHEMLDSVYRLQQKARSPGEIEFAKTKMLSVQKKLANRRLNNREKGLLGFVVESNLLAKNSFKKVKAANDNIASLSRSTYELEKAYAAQAAAIANRRAIQSSLFGRELTAIEHDILGSIIKLEHKAANLVELNIAIKKLIEFEMRHANRQLSLYEIDQLRTAVKNDVLAENALAIIERQRASGIDRDM